MAILREVVEWRKPKPANPCRAPDLTDEERTHLRAAIAFLLTRFGGRASLAKAMGIRPVALQGATGKRRSLSASLAIRAARVAGVGVDDILRGHYPPSGACPHCGHCPEPAI